jgi:hypothetical protein
VHATIVTETFLWLWDGCLWTSTDIVSRVLRSRESRRACVFGYGLLLVGRVSECSETVQVGRVRVFEELLTVFNWSQLCSRT